MSLDIILQIETINGLLYADIQLPVLPPIGSNIALAMPKFHYDSHLWLWVEVETYNFVSDSIVCECKPGDEHVFTEKLIDWCLQNGYTAKSERIELSYKRIIMPD